MRFYSVRIGALLLALLAIGGAVTWAQEPTEKQKKADEAKYRIKPHLDKSSGTGLYIPHDLPEAFRELDKMISPALRAELQHGKEKDIFKHYRFGLGLWMRNNWGLWKRLRLAQYFIKQGISDPESMSVAILRSYWRYLKHKPVALAEQVKVEQEYERQAKIAEDKEQKRVVAAKASINSMMLGMEVANSNAPSLTFATLTTGNIRVRYVALFADGFLIAARENLPVTGIRGDYHDHFISPCYFWDGKQNSLQPVHVPGMSLIDGAVVIGDVAYFNGMAAKAEVIQAVQGGKHSTIPAPPKTGQLRLGIEKASDGAVHLLAIRPHSVYRWDNNKWQVVYSGKLKLPDCAVPPQLVGDRLYFRDEGDNEDDKRLSWLDISKPDTLTYFDENVGVVGSSGPRWENVWSYTYSPDGTLWLATGSSNQSVLSWNAQDGYRVALFNDWIQFLEIFLDRTDSWHSGGYSLAATGLQSENDGIYVVGPHGIFRIVGKQIYPILKFTNCPKDWTPTHLIKRSDGSFLAGGHWGGVFLLQKDVQGTYQALSLDTKLGPPITL